MMKKIKLYGLSICAILIFAGAVVAQPKQVLPAIKNYAQYDLKQNNVDRMTVKMYYTEIDGSKVSPRTLGDFPVELTFDAAGNRIKEIVYDILTGKEAYRTNYEYNQAQGTVGEYRLDSLMNQDWKRMYTYDAKTGVRFKKYERWFNPETQELIPELLVSEETWAYDKKSKKMVQTAYKYDMKGVTTKRSSGGYSVQKGISLFMLMSEATDMNDYVWLPSFMDEYAKAQIKSTRTETVYNGKYERIFDKKNKELEEKVKYKTDGTVDFKNIYKYEYDNNGNWVKLIQYKNDIPLYIVTRDIVYR